MKRKLRTIFILFFLCQAGFSQNIEHDVVVSPEQQIQEIEKIKTQILNARDQNDTESEKLLISHLHKNYEQLQSNNYVALSATNELSFQVLPFDSKDLTWKIIVTSQLFDSSSLFNQIVDLPWEAIHGTKLAKIDKMTPKEYADYSSHVILYDKMLMDENPNITLRLIYQISPWNDASEYRFFPVTLEVLRTDYNNQVIFSLQKEDFNSASFNVYPQVEIRTFAQIEKERSQNEKILSKELSLYNKKHPSAANTKLPEQSYKKLDKINTEKNPVIQKGRSTVTLNFSDYETTQQLENFTGSNIGLDNINVMLSIGFGKFFFLEADVGGQVKDISTNQFLINIGAGLGACVNIANIFRPFILISEDYVTSENLITRFSAGLDLMIGKIFIITANYGFNMDLSIPAFDANINFFDNFSQVHSFSVGLGFNYK